jgi:bifunctional UDP-N-acetylglucosamine pyrophosphorylase/glucosamine-1-phosphate N-acetyltransferase
VNAVTVDPPVAPRPVAAIVLAAGAGTRMKSARPKVLHELAGRSMLGHALAAVEALDPQHLVVVVRHERDAVAAHTTDLAPHALIADQDEIPGTGRAVQCGLAVLPAPPSGMVIVTYGDVPMLTADTLTDLLRVHAAQRDHGDHRRQTRPHRVRTHRARRRRAGRSHRRAPRRHRRDPPDP